MQKSIEFHMLHCKIPQLSPYYWTTQPAKLDLDKKSFPKQKTIQNFTIDAQGFRKTKNENPPMQEIEVTS